MNQSAERKKESHQCWPELRYRVNTTRCKLLYGPRFPLNQVTNHDTDIPRSLIATRCVVSSVLYPCLLNKTLQRKQETTETRWSERREEANPLRQMEHPRPVPSCRLDRNLSTDDGDVEREGLSSDYRCFINMSALKSDTSHMCVCVCLWILC